jgi:hypothetical protein
VNVSIVTNPSGSRAKPKQLATEQVLVQQNGRQGITKQACFKYRKGEHHPVQYSYLKKKKKMKKKMVGYMMFCFCFHVPFDPTNGMSV